MDDGRNFESTEPFLNQSINQVYYFSSTLQARFHTKKTVEKNTSAMLNVNTTKITIVDETRECLSRQMMLTYSV